MDLLEDLHLFSQAMQIEVVSNVLFVDLDEKLVAFQVTEPTDPAITRLAVVVVVELI